MSIASEIERLRSARQDMKISIEKRGVKISESATVSDFASVLESAPYAVNGSFTPETDSPIFSISGLPFKVKSVYIVGNEVFSQNVQNASCIFAHCDNCRGVVWYKNASGENETNVLGMDSSISVYGDGSYYLDLGSKGIYFKAGYTYKFIVSGGFEQ